MRSIIIALRPWIGLSIYLVAASGQLQLAARPETPQAPPPREVTITADPPAPAIPTTEDPAHIVQRIIANAQQVGDNLAQRDVSSATRGRQAQILKDIETLLQLEPPPSNNDSQQSDQKEPSSASKNDSGSQTPSQSPTQSESQPQSPSQPQSQSGAQSLTRPQSSQSQTKEGIPPPSGHSGFSAGQSTNDTPQNTPQPQAHSGRRPRLLQAHNSPPRQKETRSLSQNPPATNSNSTPATQQPPTTSGEPRTPPADTAAKPPSVPPYAMRPDEPEWVRRVWGHLPDALRRQASEYYRQTFIPRYAKLLEHYYSSRPDK